MAEDARRFSPSSERNRDPILAVLREVLPRSGLVLEVASGSGQHSAYFAGALPQLTFQPSDPDPEALASIAAWCEGITNVRAPIALDVLTNPWPIERTDAIVNINMLQVAPRAACEGLMRGAATVLEQGSVLVMYGPYLRRDAENAPSNLEFDERLRARDPDIGLHYIEDVIATAKRHGLMHERTVEMPANNLCVVYRRC